MRIILSLLTLFVVSCLASQHAMGAITFRVESASLISDGINPTIGVVDVYLSVDDVGQADLGTPIGNWQSRIIATELTGTVSAVTFGTATEPINYADLFPSSLVRVSDLSAPGALGASDFFDSGPSLFDQAGLMSFSFSVAPGEAGSFNLTFAQTPPANLISDVNGFELDFANVGSTVTIQASAVPEPSSVAAIVCVAAVGRLVRQGRRRRRAKVSLD